MRSTLVIFDDACSMCTRSTRVVRALDWLGRFDCIGFTDAVARFPDLIDVDVDDGLRVRFADGSETVGIDAVRSIAMRTPLGALAAWLLYIPPLHVLGDRAYRFIARRRHRACAIPRR